jgi:hypothetical protein
VPRPAPNSTNTHCAPHSANNNTCCASHSAVFLQRLNTRVSRRGDSRQRKLPVFFSFLFSPLHVCPHSTRSTHILRVCRRLPHCRSCSGGPQVGPLLCLPL